MVKIFENDQMNWRVTTNLYIYDVISEGVGGFNTEEG